MRRASPGIRRVRLTMDENRSGLLDEVRGLVAARSLLDNTLAARIAECIGAGVDRSTLANVLGVDRSTLYRRYVWSTDARSATTGACGGSRPSIGDLRDP
jgi:hypothetical protein